MQFIQCTCTPPGGEQLRERLKGMFHDKYINSLCSTKDRKCRVHCFPAAAPLETCMSQFWIMSQECRSNIFSECWRERLTTAVREKAILTLEDIVPKLWTPVFARCEELLKQLMDHSLSLPTVDKLFKGNQAKIIMDHIMQFYKGVEMCHGRKEVNDFQWIKGVVDHMEQFWQLSGYAEAAQAFLKLRDTLKLSGDFQLVANVAFQVRGILCSSHYMPP